MTRFVHWRKMTWAIVVWSGGLLAWLFVAVLRAPDTSARCVTDSSGIALNVVTRQDCLAAGSGVSLQVLAFASLWLLGVAVLSVIWFVTRPLWRQGYGIRLRRLRAVPRA